MHSLCSTPLSGYWPKCEQHCLHSKLPYLKCLQPVTALAFDSTLGAKTMATSRVAIKAKITLKFILI